jgi:hypothetical protein
MIINADTNKVSFVCFIMLAAFIIQKAVKTLSVLNDDCTRSLRGISFLLRCLAPEMANGDSNAIGGVYKGSERLKR